jgi:glutaredoxin
VESQPPWAGEPTATPSAAIPITQQAFPTAPVHLGDTTPQVARLLATPPVELPVAAPMTTPAPLTSPGNLAPFEFGPTTPAKEEPTRMITSSGNQIAIPDARDHAKVIVYGRSGSTACMRAIQDLMERQISFQYVDVSRDSDAAAHLAAICNGEPVVPVIVHIGFNA